MWICWETSSMNVDAFKGLNDRKARNSCWHIHTAPQFKYGEKNSHQKLQIFHSFIDWRAIRAAWKVSTFGGLQISFHFTRFLDRKRVVGPVPIPFPHRAFVLHNNLLGLRKRNSWIFREYFHVVGWCFRQFQLNPLRSSANATRLAVQ